MMLIRWLINQVTAAGRAWQQFWFLPAEPHTLAVVRIFAGAMLFYTHLVWSLDLNSFLGTDGWLPNELAREMHRDGYALSYLWFVESPTLLWTLHLAGLVVFALLTVGLFSRVMAVLAWMITVSYCQRLSGAFFGLDQVNSMLAMYLMLGPCGAVYSVDRWRADRAGQGEPGTFISANLAVRLMQVHLCIIYLFGGISKMRGQFWWDGSAVWYAVANLEYQSVDMTWLIYSPFLTALLTHLTIFWETFYCVLIWPRRTRPIILAMAVAVHGGIAACLGMITFGLAMLIANVAFVPPSVVREVVSWLPRGRGVSAELSVVGRRTQPER